MNKMADTVIKDMD